MNAKNLLKRAACLFSLTGLALSVSAQSRFADAMRQAYAKPERIYQFKFRKFLSLLSLVHKSV